MVLFADAGAWLPPVMTTLAAIAAGYFARVTQRDKLAHDAELTALRYELRDLKADVASCHAERDGLKAEIAGLKVQNAAQQLQINELRAADAARHE